MRTHTRLAGLLVAVAAAALDVVATAPVATAHAELESTTPRQGATVARMPQQVTLTFTDSVRTPAFVEVTGPDGTDVATGEVGVRDEVLSRPVGEATGGGGYAMAYRVTSADGHPISGMVRFTVTGGAGGSDADDGTELSTPTANGGGAVGAGEPAQQTSAAPVEESGGLGTTGLALVLVALVLGLVALATGTQRALRHSSTMVDDANAGRARRG